MTKIEAIMFIRSGFRIREVKENVGIIPAISPEYDEEQPSRARWK